MECCGYSDRICTRRLRHRQRRKMGYIRRHSVGGPLPLRPGSVGVLPLLEGISSKRLTGEEFLEDLTLSRPADRVPAPEAFQWTQRTRPTVLRADRADCRARHPRRTPFGPRPAANVTTAEVQRTPNEVPANASHFRPNSCRCRWRSCRVHMIAVSMAFHAHPLAFAADIWPVADAGGRNERSDGLRLVKKNLDEARAGVSRSPR